MFDILEIYVLNMQFFQNKIFYTDNLGHEINVGTD